MRRFHPTFPSPFWHFSLLRFLFLSSQEDKAMTGKVKLCGEPFDSKCSQCKTCHTRQICARRSSTSAISNLVDKFVIKPRKETQSESRQIQTWGTKKRRAEYFGNSEFIQKIRNWTGFCLHCHTGNYEETTWKITKTKKELQID